MKFLFYSPHALADSSSGAARSVSTLLSELVALGHECMAVTGSLVDAPNDLFSKVLELPHAESMKLPEFGQVVPIRTVSLQNVTHSIVCFRGAKIADFTALEEFALQRHFQDSFAKFQPDVVISYGGFTSNYFVGLYAMSQGRKSVLYAATDSYRTPEHFIHVDRVVAVSGALCRKLDMVTRVRKMTIPPLIRKSDVVGEEREREFITFINPAPAKGLRLAAALVHECNKRGRGHKFLFVEGRASQEMVLKACPELNGLKNLYFAQNTSDMRLVYRRTSVLLVPSVWWEAAGQVCMEANANGIPIIGSNIGGIPEMMDGAGYLIDPPPASVQDWDAPVPLEVVEKWLEVLRRLHADPAERKDAERRAREADARYDSLEFARRFAAFAAE